MTTSNIKLFQLDDYDTWAAESLEQAIAAAREEFGEGSYEDAEQDAVEIPRERWDTLKVRIDEDGELPPITYAEALADMVKEGKRFPLLFCSTEY